MNVRHSWFVADSSRSDSSGFSRREMMRAVAVLLNGILRTDGQNVLAIAVSGATARDLGTVTLVNLGTMAGGA
jgi:hypothetical protein